MSNIEPTPTLSKSLHVWMVWDNYNIYYKFIALVHVKEICWVVPFFLKVKSTRNHPIVTAFLWKHILFVGHKHCNIIPSYNCHTSKQIFGPDNDLINFEVGRIFDQHTQCNLIVGDVCSQYIPRCVIDWWCAQSAKLNHIFAANHVYSGSDGKKNWI